MYIFNIELIATIFKLKTIIYYLIAYTIGLQMEFDFVAIAPIIVPSGVTGNNSKIEE